MPQTTDVFADDWGSQDELLKRLQEKTKVLQTPRFIEAFKSVDRADFMQPGYKVEAYEDYAVPIGEDQTISQPTTVAYMLELLDAQEGDNVLDVGCGSGWTTALLAEIVGEEGRVVGVELRESLANFGQKNLAKYEYENAAIRQLDAAHETAEEAPFDRILVSAAAEEVPDILLGQLKNDGTLVMPVGESIVKIVKKKGQESEMSEHPGFRFVNFEQ